MISQFLAYDFFKSLEYRQEYSSFGKKNYICMPKIFEYFGFVFFFYSNEHEPIHVHVVKGELAKVKI